jgi:hypothetical protein
MWFGGLLMGIGISLMTLPIGISYLNDIDLINKCTEKGSYIAGQTIIICEVQ